MIAKKTTMKAVGKSSIKGLVKYITSEQGKAERVGEITVTNCNNDDIKWAILEIESVQKLNTQSKIDKTYHLLISFPAGEFPPPPVLSDIESELCKSLGYLEHQRISVVHEDTDNIHVHVAINKIHPTKFTAHEPYRDYKTIAEVCKKLQIKHNLQDTNHKAKNNKSDNKANDFEKHSGEETFLAWMKENHSEKMLSLNSWSELGNYLDEIGVEILPRGNGLIFRDQFNDIAVKASSVHRLLSKPQLEKMFDSFVTPETAPTKNIFSFLEDSKAMEQLFNAGSWAEFNKILVSSGVEIKKRGNGFVIADLKSGETVKASDINRGFSKSKLELKFGPFEKLIEKQTQKKKNSFTKGMPRETYDNQLYLQYQNVRSKFSTIIDKEKLLIDKKREAAITAAKRKAKMKRAIIKLSNSSPLQKKILYAAVGKTLKEDMNIAHANSKKEKSYIFDANKRLTWYDWLQLEARKNNEKALNALKKRRETTVTGNHVVGNSGKNKSFIDGCSINNVTKSGTVVYEHDSCVIRDYGDSLKITKGATDEAIKQFIESSVKKFGEKLTFKGSEEFKEHVLRVADKEGLKIKFGDLDMEKKRISGIKKGRKGVKR